MNDEILRRAADKAEEDQDVLELIHRQMYRKYGQGYESSEGLITDFQTGDLRTGPVDLDVEATRLHFLASVGLDWLAGQHEERHYMAGGEPCEQCDRAREAGRYTALLEEPGSD